MREIPKILRVPFFGGRFAVLDSGSPRRLSYILPLFFLVFGAVRINAQQISRPRQLTQPDYGQNQAAKERRIALVIGNGHYHHATALKNPTNDANDIAKALQELGFEVVGGHAQLDQTSSEMRQVIREFGERLKNGGGIGLVYYAGHGVQVGGRNYLVPIEVTGLRPQTIEDDALDVARILREMHAATSRVNIVILDACRSNPFTRSWDSVEGGLAKIDAPPGTLIAYATAPGALADDGNERNGLYTSELIRWMRQPGLNVEEMFKRVRTSVVALSGGKQVPAEYSVLTRDFYFARMGTLTDNPSISRSDEMPSTELVFWETIKNSTNPEDFKAYLKNYPNGRFVDLARIRSNPGPVQNRRSDVAGEGAVTVQNRVTIKVYGDSLYHKPTETNAGSSANGWTSSGLFIQRGQRVHISASNRMTLWSSMVSTPAGVPELQDSGKLMRSQATGILIAVIGDDNDDFIAVGQEREFLAQRDGVLYLGVNISPSGTVPNSVASSSATASSSAKSTGFGISSSSSTATATSSSVVAASPQPALPRNRGEYDVIVEVFPTNKSNDTADPITATKWFAHEGTIKALPVFLTFEAGGGVTIRTSKGNSEVVANNVIWFRSADLLHLLWFEDQNQNTLSIEYVGTIKGNRIEGTGRRIRDNVTFKWTFTKVIE